jgi:hypothetical protein
MSDRDARSLAAEIARQAAALRDDDTILGREVRAYLDQCAHHIRQAVAVPWPPDMTTGAVADDTEAETC